MIRDATTDDLDALLRLEDTSFETDRMSRSSLRRLLGSATAVFLVDEAGGDVTGYILLLVRASSNRARLYSLAVDAARRGRGIGRRLVEAAERRVGDLGIGEIRLEIREDNEASRALFASCGYEPFRTIEDYYEDGATAVRYSKRLGSGRNEESGHAEQAGGRR
ncbi:MAG: GNAT family N-acetyltransferase [Candidatus Eisenbacteria bacterium]|nr:GNAT family N-acetyltransferase [Candidatus Eisenbacteria bacterium]